MEAGWIFHKCIPTACVCDRAEKVSEETTQICRQNPVDMVTHRTPTADNACVCAGRINSQNNDQKNFRESLIDQNSSENALSSSELFIIAERLEMEASIHGCPSLWL